MRIYLYDDWRSRPHALLTDLCTFLEVDPVLLPAQVERRNVTVWPRSRMLAWLLHRTHSLRAALPRWTHRGVGARLRTWNNIPPPPLDPHLRRELTARYHDAISALQTLIGRDLAHWYED
jgi:hypothetical protein